jgi:hypothetical protein
MFAPLVEAGNDPDHTVECARGEALLLHPGYVFFYILPPQTLMQNPRLEVASMR